MIFSLLDTPAYGGAEEYLLTVLFHLQKKGHHVVLATNNDQVKEKCGGRINVINLPYRLDAIGNWRGLVKYFLALPSSIFWLISIIHNFEKPVTCLFPGYSDRLSFSPIVKWLKCRLIWLEYGPLEPTFTRNHGFPKLLYAIGRPFPDIIVTISEWTKKSLVEVGKIQKERIRIIYPGVDTGLQRTENRLQKNKAFTAVAVARLAKEKEIDLLLRAWAKLKMPKAKLHIIGDGPEREHLEKLSKDLCISDSVHFNGFVSSEQKQAILLDADIFVFPSAWELEGFGMTTIEAMSAHLPIITTGFGPQSEIVKAGENGWYFKPHDDNDLTRVIELAMRSKIINRYRQKSQQIVQRKFNRKEMLSLWEDVIPLE